MKRLQRNITDKKNLWKLLLLIFVFSSTFLIIYTPFETTSWFPKEDRGSINFFIFLFIPIFIGIFVLIISRYIMYFYHKKHEISYVLFGCWSVVEIIIMAIIYTLINKLAFSDGRDYFIIFERAIFYIALFLIIPYAFALLYFSLQDKKAIIQNMQEGIENNTLDSEILNFFDEKGTLRLSVLYDCVLSIVAADNYVTVNYLVKDQKSQLMIKTSLNKIEDTFKEKGLVRCNRYCVVNMNKVEVIRKDKSGLVLEMANHDYDKILVSKVYAESVINAFGKF